MFRRAFSILKDTSTIKGYTRGVDTLIAKGIPKEEAVKFMTEFAAHPSYNPNLTVHPYITDTYRHSFNAGGLSNFIAQTQVLEKKLKFDPNVRSHIDLIDSPGSEENRNKLFVRKINELGKSYIEEATQEEKVKANVFAVGGIDFDTKMHMSSLLKAVEALKQYCNPKPHWTCNPVAIFPQVSKSERYEAAVQYNLDKTYCPKYIKDFVEEYILPRMQDSQNLEKLKEPQIGITFFSYSVGGREIYMIENAIRTALLDKGHSKEEIFEIFKCFVGVSVAYAVDIDQLQDTIYFTKIILYNEGDSGVLQPESLTGLFRNWDPSDGGYIHKINTDDKISHDQYLFVVPDVHEIWDKDKFSGHGLNSYLKAIGEFEPEAKELIGESFYSYNETEGE